MAACEVCGEGDQFLFGCQYCSGQFCSDHRPPGQHLCGDAPPIVRIREEYPDPAVTGGEAAAGGISSEPAEATETPRGRLPNRQQFLRTKSLVVIAAILLVTSAVGGYALLGTGLLSGLDYDLSNLTEGQPGAASTDVPTDELNRTAVERLVVHRMNALREDRGSASATYDSALAEIAESHSDDMAARNYTSHVSPDGVTVSDRYAEFGYECDTPGELIVFTRYGGDVETANGSPGVWNQNELADAIVDLWLQSEHHRRALLTQPWEAVGVGVAVTDDSRVFVTLNAC